MAWMFLLALSALVVLVVLSSKAVWWKAGSLALLALALSAWWLIDRLSGDGLNAATLYHLQSEMTGAGVADFSKDIAIFIFLALLSLCALLLPRLHRWRLPRHGNAVLAAFCATFALTVIASPLATDAMRLYHRLQPVDHSGIVGEYRKPERPLRTPRNIVWIYAESLERTYLDADTFPGLTPNLSRLATQGLDVRRLDSVEGTGWTIAGMVASMCGVPLTAEPGDENSMGRIGTFLPDAWCLGDHLKRQGYRTRFIGGADAAFAGKGQFLRTHGFDDVRDRQYFRRLGIHARHFSQWGVHDDVLLEDAWSSFQELAADGRPFLLTTLTMDTHHPAGHLPQSCQGQHYRNRTLGQVGLLDAIQCSDRLIGELVAKIRNSPHADDTLIVIGSDHLAMPNDLSDVLARLPRENLLLFLGRDIQPRQVVAQHGSTLDSGATLLHLLDPQQRAIGFGRSLLDPNREPSASHAARSGDGSDYRRYLSYARTLWTDPNADMRQLRIDADGQLLAGNQRIQPPVLLEYDPAWQVTGMYLENIWRRLEPGKRAPALAYVDRCTAFEDEAVDSDWCALLVNPANGTQLVTGDALERGIQVDTEAGRAAPTRERVRYPRVLANRIANAGRGQYVWRMRSEHQPNAPFWLEALSEQGQVLARRWVQPNAAGRYSLELGLEQPIDGLRIRAWLDPEDDFRLSSHLLLPVEALASTTPDDPRRDDLL